MVANHLTEVLHLPIHNTELLGCVGDCLRFYDGFVPFQSIIMPLYEGLPSCSGRIKPAYDRFFLLIARALLDRRAPQKDKILLTENPLFCQRFLRLKKLNIHLIIACNCGGGEQRSLVRNDSEYSAFSDVANVGH